MKGQQGMQKTAFQHLKEIRSGGVVAIVDKLSFFSRWATHRRRWWFKLFMHPGFLNPSVWLVAEKYRVRQVPFRQAATFGALIRFAALLDDIGVDYFLSGGALLGGVRQGSFAGRPDDIDIAINQSFSQQFVDAEDILKSRGFSFRWLETEPAGKKCRVRYRYGADLDIHFYSSTPTVYEQKHFKLEKELREENKVNRVNFFIFGESFPGPGDTLDFLERFYGAGWVVPDGKQIADS